MSPLGLQARARRRRVEAPASRAATACACPGAPGDEGVDLSSMSPAMVDRLFWRAGFGPTDKDRATWTGKPVSEAVAWLLSAPAGRRRVARARARASRSTRPATTPTSSSAGSTRWSAARTRSSSAWRSSGTATGPTRATSVSPPQLLLRAERPVPPLLGLRRQRRRLVPRPRLRGDGRPVDAALPHRRVQREGRAERELRPRADGALRPRRPGPERQAELHRERRAPARQGALRLADQRRDPDNAKSYFTPDRWYNGPKIVFGKFGNYKQNEAVDLVLAHPAHARFIVEKLWSEFIVRAAGRRDAAVARSPRTPAAA